MINILLMLNAYPGLNSYLVQLYTNASKFTKKSQNSDLL